jgi:hypothetical protein
MDILMNHFYGGGPLDENRIRELIARGADPEAAIEVSPEAQEIVDRIRQQAKSPDADRHEMEVNPATVPTDILMGILANCFFNEIPFDPDQVRELLAQGANIEAVLEMIPQARGMIGKIMAETTRAGTTVEGRIRQQIEELYVNEEEVEDIQRIVLSWFPGCETIINRELNRIQNVGRSDEDISREIVTAVRELHEAGIAPEDIRTILREEYPDSQDIAAINSAIAAYETGN